MSIFTLTQHEQLDLFRTHHQTAHEHERRDGSVYEVHSVTRFISRSVGNALILMVKEAVIAVSKEQVYLVSFLRAGMVDQVATIPATLDALLELLVKWEYEPAYGASRRFFIDEFITEL